MLNFEVAIKKNSVTISRVPREIVLPPGIGSFTVSQDKVGQLLEKLELLNQHIQIAIESPDALARDISYSPVAQTLRSFGHELFETFFVEAKDKSQQSLLFYYGKLEALTTLDQPVRFQLYIDDPELGVLPWEFLNWDDRFLALSNVLFTRRVTKNEIETIVVNEPLSILVVFANPDISGKVYANLEVEIKQERETLKTELGSLVNSGLVQIDFLDELGFSSRATLDRMYQALRAKNYHIIYYFGHGDIDGSGTSFLVFEGHHQDGHRVRGQPLIEVIKDVIPSVGLVILNACWTAQNQNAAQNFRHNVLFGGVATSMFSSTRSKIASVVAMPFPIGVDTAAQFRLRFFREFVRDLVANGSLEETMAAVRRDICFRGNNIEGLLPILFSRSRSGTIFEVDVIGMIRNLFNEAKALYQAEKYEKAEKIYKKLEELPPELVRSVLESERGSDRGQ